MKKFLLSLMFAAGFAGIANAQAKPAVAAKSKTEVKTVAKMPSANASPVAKAAVTKTEVKVKPNGKVKMKADGTPDMRYSANKMAAPAAAGPKKKDGTADMRYKANKK